MTPRYLFIFVILAALIGMNQPSNASGFTNQSDDNKKFTPVVEPYELKPDLSNVSNIDDFEISKEAMEILAKNYILIDPTYAYSEFFELYENNRYEIVPSFITTDSILHNYHLIFDFILRRLEEEKLIAELTKLNALMLKSSLEQYNTLKGTEWEVAAKRNVGYFAVAGRLLDPKIEIPAIVKTEVVKEIKLIESHSSPMEISPVMNMGAKFDPLENLKEDYTQYIPRGHYDKSEELRKYFKSMMWYGRMTFRLKYEDEVKSLMLMVYAISEKANFESWERIYEPTCFFVGKSDDITYYQIKEIMDKVYGVGSSWKALPEDSFRFFEAIELMKKLDPPQINSMPIFDVRIQPDRESEIKGFRFMGQRFTLDASIFQRLVDREVPQRMLPKGLDIPAAMGSEEALSILDSMGETKFTNYRENMQKMRKFISGLKEDTWLQNLYWGWLYSLLPLTTEKPDGYPSFMRTQAWTRKDLNTYLGSWTELKHDTILYAKQCGAEAGGGPTFSESDDRGYVEPNPYLYDRLTTLVQLTKSGLEKRNLLSEHIKKILSIMERLTQSLETISIKELTNVSLTEEEHELIRSYGVQLEHLWLEVNKEVMERHNMSIRDALWDDPAAIVADVATSPFGTVLEEGTGHIFHFYAIVPVEGKLKLVSGGIYSHYEFEWDSSDRLTDQKWKEMRYDKRWDFNDWIKPYACKERGISRKILGWED